MPIDYKKYPPNWLKEIRPRIMKRANDSCEWPGCGFKHKQEVYQAVSRRKENGDYAKKQFVKWFATFEEARKQCGILAFEKPVKVIITIAHLDHDELNWNVKDERLMAMCQLHHTRYDAKEKYRRSKLNWELQSKPK